ncbi:MAG: hypothetical protein Q8W44_01305 [Candidatus Palauibacterales bacterium]|nr:hypothetical protein [Candidatus Palauibacterales bacterium]
MADSAVIEKLERRIDRLQESRSPSRVPESGGEVAPTGVDALDELLPRGGLPRGEAVEWVGPRSCGKTALLRSVLARLRARGESVALVDARRTLYAPDWAPLAGEDSGFWVVRPSDPQEASWCADLLLRSGAFGGVALVPGGEAPASPEDGGAGREAGGRRESGAPALGRSAVIRLQRLAEESGSLFVAAGRLPVAALRLRFRPGRVEPVGKRLFGPFLPGFRPLWVRLPGSGGRREVPVLCPELPRRSVPASGRDRKGRR